VLYNKKERKIEIFFDNAQRLAQNFNSHSIKPFKALNTDENFLIAINEPKELVAIYDAMRVVVSQIFFRCFIIS
jgi:hypothetical protein